MKNIRYIGAGAGSGKTFDLTEKIVGLVLEGCRMSELILTTFTKKAAAEFRKKTREKLLSRAEKQTDPGKRTLLLTASTELDSAMIGTVHSVCMQYIRKYWYKLGMSARVTEMDDDTKTEHMNRTLVGSADDGDIAFFQNFAYEFDIRGDYGSGRVNPEFWRDYLGKVIESADSFDIDDLSRSEEESQKLAAMALSLDGCAIIPHEDGKDDDYYRGQMRECIARIFKIARKWRAEFRTYKEERALIQFSDMETRFLELLGDDEVRREISSSIRFLFVDEFQDSNPKQIKIFDSLSDLVQESWWVGDPKQSIYKFRGSDIELVRAVINKKGGEVVKEKPLEYSWRSEKRLVETANAVFAPVFTGVLSDGEITLKSHREDRLPGGARSLHHWDLRKGPNPFKEDNSLGCTKDMLALAIAGQIDDMVQGRHEIHKVIDKDSGESRDICPNDIAVLTRSGASSEKIISFLVERGIPVIHEDKIEPNSYELQCVALLLNHIITRESSLLDAELCRLLFDMSLEDILAKNLSDLRETVSSLDAIKGEIGTGSIAGMVRSIILRFDLLNVCGKWGWKDERRKNLICLMKAAEDYDAQCLDNGESATVEGFLSEISDGVDVPEGYSPGGVTVCTYHKSKGLEWGVVILFDLASDSSSDKICLKRYVTGTKIVRMDAPTSENIYSDYYITMVPSFSSKDIQGKAAKVIMDTAAFREFQRQEIAEAQRLLYVGFTRARDYLVSTSNRGNGRFGPMQWFDSIDLDPKVVNPDWPDGTPQEIWGSGTEKVNFRKIDAVPAQERREEANYRCLGEIRPDATEEPKRIMPSALPLDEAARRATLSFIGDEGGEFIQIIRTVRPQDKETAIGSCIHNIFAAYNRNAPVEKMNEIARRTVKNFSLEKHLPDPESIIEIISGLYDFLTRAYGPAVKTGREIPFRRIIDGQTCIGSIDFVWYTSECECVLVDYKNISMATTAVIDPESDEYIGHYIPQQKAYKDALEQSGLMVLDCLLYLSLQGRAVRIAF